MELVINQKGWVMFDNKPVEIIVSKIQETLLMVVNEKEPRQITIISASFSENYEHEITINESLIFASKIDLMEAVFNT